MLAEPWGERSNKASVQKSECSAVLMTTTRLENVKM